MAWCHWATSCHLRECWVDTDICHHMVSLGHKSSQMLKSSLWNLTGGSEMVSTTEIPVKFQGNKTKQSKNLNISCGFELSQSHSKKSSCLDHWCAANSCTVAECYHEWHVQQIACFTYWLLDMAFLPCTKVISEVIPEIWLFSKFDPQNPMSKLWIRSKVKVTQGKHQLVDSYPFRFKSSRSSVPEVKLFYQIWTWKKLYCPSHG